MAENVAIDLYKGGVFLRNIATDAPGTGAAVFTDDSAASAPNRFYRVRVP